MEDTALMGYFHFIRYVHRATSPKFRFAFELFSLIIISLFVSTLFVMHNQFVGKSDCLNLPNNTRFDILSIEIKGDTSIFSRHHIYTKTQYENNHHSFGSGGDNEGDDEDTFGEMLKGAAIKNKQFREDFYQNIGSDLLLKDLGDDLIVEPCIDDSDIQHQQHQTQHQQNQPINSIYKTNYQLIMEYFQQLYHYVYNIIVLFFNSQSDEYEEKIHKERQEREHMKRLKEELKKHIKDIDKNHAKFEQLIKSYDDEFEHIRSTRDTIEKQQQQAQALQAQQALQTYKIRVTTGGGSNGYLDDINDVVQYFIDSHNPRYEFSYQNAFLMLTTEQRNKFNITTLHIDISANDKCLGNLFHRTIIRMLGYDILMINNLVYGFPSTGSTSSSKGYLRIAGDSHLINLYQYSSPIFAFNNESLFYIAYRFFETNLIFFSTLVVFGSSLKLCESCFARYIDHDPRGVLRCMLHNLLIASLFIFIQIGYVSLFSIILSTEYLVFFISSLITSYFSTWGLRSKESIKYYPIIFLSILYGLILYVVFFPAGFHPIAFYACYSLIEYLLIICLFNFEIPAVLNNRILSSFNQNNNQNTINNNNQNNNNQNNEIIIPPVQLDNSNNNNTTIVNISNQQQITQRHFLNSNNIGSS